jgi:hypothetical protein
MAGTVFQTVVQQRASAFMDSAQMERHGSAIAARALRLRSFREWLRLYSITTGNRTPT